MRVKVLVGLIAVTGIRAVSAETELPLPPLSMRDITYRTEQLGEGTYAVIPDKWVRNSSGFIIGDNGVLVIDGIFNADKAGAVIAEVRKVTNKPILYAVNTNYNCDHVCGNSAFPATTRIVAQNLTKRLMADYDENRRLIQRFIPESEAFLLEDAKSAERQPDIIFDNQMQIDLGNRIVELWHFGTGSTPGDTIVYDPLTKTAWTGNMLMGKGMLTIFSGHGSVAEFASTLSKLNQTLDIEHIVPGHPLGQVESGDLVTDQLYYATQLMKRVRSGISDGLTEDQTVERYPLIDLPRPPGVDSWLNTLGRAHELNLRKSYRVMIAAE